MKELNEEQKAQVNKLLEKIEDDEERAECIPQHG
jgi:hypothetical protein